MGIGSEGDAHESIDYGASAGERELGYTSALGAIDKSLFHWINQWPDSFAPVFVYFSEATKAKEFRIWTIGLILAVLVLYIAKAGKWRTAALLALLAWPIANGFTEAFKTAIPMLRPCNELSDVILRVGKLESFGTTSSHAANMAAVAFVFMYYLRGWGAPWIVVAILTGLSRIYVGVHYPSQVFLGWICGAVSGLIAVKTYEAFVTLRRNRRESETVT